MVASVCTLSELLTEGTVFMEPLEYAELKQPSVVKVPPFLTVEEWKSPSRARTNIENHTEIARKKKKLEL